MKTKHGAKKPTKKRPNPFTGCGGSLLLIALALGALIMADSVPAYTTGQGKAIAIPVWVWLPAAVGILAFLWNILTGKAGLMWVLVAFAIAAALIGLNASPYMPGIEGNPCPGQEISIMVNGQCHGMDADANRAWLENLLEGK